LCLLEHLPSPRDPLTEGTRDVEREDDPASPLPRGGENPFSERLHYLRLASKPYDLCDVVLLLNRLGRCDAKLEWDRPLGRADGGRLANPTLLALGVAGESVESLLPRSRRVRAGPYRNP